MLPGKSVKCKSVWGVVTWNAFPKRHAYSKSKQGFLMTCVCLSNQSTIELELTVLGVGCSPFCTSYIYPFFP